ncbi:hypothetical protein Tco_1503715 [Tanacetum coccineum]
MFFEGIDQRIPFTMTAMHKGVMYLNQYNIKSLMKLSKVKKFCDGTLVKIQENLIDMLSKNKLEEHQSPSSNKDKPEPSHSPETQVSDSNSSSPDLIRFDNTLPLTERQLVKSLRKASIEGYYEENVDHREQTNKLVQATMDSLDKTAIDRVNLLNALNGVTDTLKAVQDVIKDDPALNKKVIEAIEAYTRNSSALTKLLSLVKNFDFQGLKSLVKSLKVVALRQDEHLASWANSSNSLAWNLGPRIIAVERGENDTHADTDEPPSHTKGEHVAMEDDKAEEGKAISTDDQPEVQTKLVPASKELCPDLDAPILVPYDINGKNFQLTKEQIQTHMDKEEQIKKAAEKAKLFEMTKTEVIKDAEHQVLKREYSQKAKSAIELRKKRLKKILEELGIQSALPAPVPKQAPFKSSRRKRKHMELEPEIKVPRLECNRSLPEGVPFVNNMVIKEPKYVIFFTNVFGDQAFQRWNDTHKVRVDSLVSYLVMASMIKTQENGRFSLKLRKLIAEHPDQEKLKSKRLKLEALGYKLD